MLKQKTVMTNQLITATVELDALLVKKYPQVSVKRHVNPQQ